MVRIDTSILAELEKYSTPGTGDIVAELITVYLQSSEASLHGLRPLLHNQDFNEIAGIAHSQKSSAGSVGAKGLQACLETVETAAKAGDVVALTALVTETESLYLEIQSELSQLLAARKAK